MDRSIRQTPASAGWLLASQTSRRATGPAHNRSHPPPSSVSSISLEPRLPRPRYIASMAIRQPLRDRSSFPGATRYRQMTAIIWLVHPGSSNCRKIPPSFRPQPESRPESWFSGIRGGGPNSASVPGSRLRPGQREGGAFKQLNDLSVHHILDPVGVGCYTALVRAVSSVG